MLTINENSIATYKTYKLWASWVIYVIRCQVFSAMMILHIHEREGYSLLMATQKNTLYESMGTALEWFEKKIMYNNHFLQLHQYILIE
jgi:hypothetical protein